MNKTKGLMEWLPWKHRLIVWAVQLAIFAFAGILAFQLRFDFRIYPEHDSHLFYAITIWIVIKSVVFRLLNLDRGWWRYVSIADFLRVAVGNVASSFLSCAAISWMAPSGFPRSLYVLDLILCFMGTAGVRVIVRVVVEALGNARNRDLHTNTLIYGAGSAGFSLLREIQNNPKLPYRVQGFIDDRPDKLGIRILGTSVLGNGTNIPALVKAGGIQMVFIAIPSANGAEMTRILESVHAAGVECKTVPGLGEVIAEQGLVGQIRDVAVEDLLGRTPARLEESQIRAHIEGNVVMVTGAAGSIGSELCRQIARFNPAGIVGFEIAESPLFSIDREMRQDFPNIAFYPEIGNIQNRTRINEVLQKYSPSVIYHAAAYKHVPMMEAHVYEAVENNIFGTYNLAMAASEYGVDAFVMISSDKAVRPTNIMGATKRVAELLLLALDNGRTKYVAVRFGNVLGSNGSVIPIFKKQIAAGGPVTVTHPDMRRFFMTIPEACQLVLQAAVIGRGGQICVLDMGEPVRIVDLARNLILLSGLRPEQDVKIEFSGMRPGEKLYEEISGDAEDTAPTVHEKIRIYTGGGMPQGDMLSWLDHLRNICDLRDDGQLVLALKEIVMDYSPSAHLLKRVIMPREQHAAVSLAMY